MAKAAAAPRIQTEVIECRGGLNTTAPSYAMRAGQAMLAINYELDQRGNYRRMTGFERFDGRPAPSEAPRPNLVADYDTFMAQWQADQNVRRALIQPVPGTGPVRGVVQYAGSVYAFRDFVNEGSPECRMYRATSGGWALVTTPVLAPSGKYQFVTANFLGAVTGVKLFGVDGKNKPFMFDGTTFTQLSPGPVGVFPTSIAEHQKHLFIGYAAGSILHSKLGDPTNWTALAGAGEIGLGDKVTGLVSTLGGVLVILCAGSAHVLTGKTIDSFERQTISTSSGAFPFTAQEIGDVMFQNDAGLTSLQRTQNFGGFNAGVVSNDVKQIFDAYLSRFTASVAVKKKNHVRYFADDGTGVVVTLVPGAQDVPPIQFTMFDLPFVVNGAWAGEKENGEELLFVGADNGYVYQLDAGRSADGAEIEAVLRLVFHGGAARQRKRFFRAAINVHADELATLRIKRDFDYVSAAQIKQGVIDRSFTVGGDFFGSPTARFGMSRWGGKILADTMLPIAGVGYTVSLLFYTKEAFELPHTLQAVTLDFTYRRRDIASDAVAANDADPNTVLGGDQNVMAPNTALLGNAEDFMARWTTARTGTTLKHGDHVVADNTLAPCVYVLPAVKSDGDTVRIRQSEVSFAAHYCDVMRNGSTIRGVADDVRLNIDDWGYDFVWRATLNTWMIYRIGEAAD